MPIRLMVALLAICTTAFTTNVYAAYGRTVGNFGVSAVGSAQYSIPIWAPPGPRGIQPQVSLSYDSDQWIGPMGIGWALGGLGQITRCNKTVAQDGASTAVGLSASDGYCFNGNRLRMVTGTYGEAGSTYQTEIADFSDITANGTAGNGPEYWSVRAKNGLTYYFGFVDANGNGANSAPVAQGTTTVLTWFLSKVIDRAGNNYVVNYTAQTGTAVPASILWTPTGYGTSTYAYKMLFNYSGNNPATSSIQYVDGTLVSNTELLSSIEILASGVVIKDYFLGYQLSPSTGRNEMISVLECADSGKANCLLPTSISYQGGSPGVSTTPNTAAPGGAQLTARYDLNGDGYPDLFYAVGSTMYVAFGSATGYQTPFNTGIPTTAVVGRLTGGIQDAVLANNGGTWYYYNWNGSSFTGTSTKISYDTSSAGYQLADINGDGLPDLIDLNYVYSSFTKKYTASIITILNTTAGGTFGLSETSNTGYSAVVVSAQLLPPDMQYGKLRRYDFNGDGLDDIVLKTITGTSPNYYINTEELISNGSGFTAQTISSALNGSYAPVFFTDWNDDRCTDFVSVNVLYIAGCNGTAAETYSLPGTLLLAFDWNADGRTDILVANGSTIGVYLAGGSGAPTLTPTTFPYNSSCLYVRLDVTADGLDDLGCQTTSLTYYLHNGTSDLATAFSDGYGNSAQPNYIPISEGSYTNATDAIAGYQNYIGPLYVVNQVTYSDPSNQPSGSYQQTFTYAGAWMNLQGRGFSGFESIQAHDSRNSVWSTSSYNLGFPYTGMLTSSIASQNSNNTTPISTLANTLAVQTLIPTANNESYFPYVSKSTTESYEVGGTKNGQLITTSVTTYGAPSDNYGNFDTVSTVLMDNDSGSPYYNDTWTTTTVNTISADASTWCLGLPSETAVTNSSTAPNGTAITRTVSYPSPDYANCRETQKITAQNTAYQVTEVYGYDSTFGNLLTDSITGYNAVTKVTMPTRTTTLTWNSTGQFPQTVQNALMQTITLGFDPNSGMKTSQTDPNWTKANPLTTTWAPDPFFRVSSQTNLDGTSMTWAYNNCATNGCVNANNRMTVTQTTLNSGGGTQRIANTYTDSLGRTLVTSKQMLNGAYDRNETRYDNLGRVHVQMAPCTFVSCTSYATTNTYDILNRITESQRPISATNSTLQSTIFGYAGRTATVQDPLMNTRTLVSLVTGALARTTDAKGYSINLSYDAFGSLVATTDNASPANTLSTAQYSYGLKAFKTASTDMDRGPRSYTVDPLGEVTAYTDAKNQTFSITYDALSRKMVRTEPDLTTTWNWGNEAASYNIGKLASVTAVSSAGTWSDAYSYDSLTRYSSETISNPGDRTYTYAKTYDLTTGLPASLQYPADTSFILTLQYGYAYGILQSVSSNSYSPAVTYWTADTMNARGQVTQETLGNGVVKASSYDAVTGWLMGVQAGAGGGSSLQNDGFSYDGDGNLLLRQDNNRGLTEDYFYDALNRLDHTTLNNVMNLQMEYDSTGMGNVASRSDVAGGATWTYDPVRKHAVTQAGSSVYTYDDNGNASSRNGYPITWTSSNLPTGISTASESVQYAYDANRQRWQEIYTGGPNGTETTYRAGKLFEVDTYGGVAHYRHFVYAGNELVSIDDVTSAAAPQYYVMSDHQGSLESIITSATSATEGCPAGYTLSGSTCTEVLSQAATATYSCPTGYTLSGTNCTDTASLAATANYSCPTGYTLSGTSCTDTLTVAATVNHSCPTGYSLSGTTCSEVLTAAATLSYSCPSGYTLSGTTCSETQSYAATIVFSCSPKPCISGTYTYTCPKGGTLSGTTCYLTVTQAATGTYSCSAGYALSGTTCSETVTQTASTSYSCPTSYNLSGTTCSDTLSENASVSYSCPTGYSLSGSTCSETATVAATVGYSCPTGYTLSGTTCGETLTVSATNSYPGIYVAESYSPYGQRRNGETWSGAPTAGDEAAINNVSRIGFTREWAIGTSMGLNHFNGRVEDSILGRFISPDSFIPDPTDTQSYNRYSYVKNNPATRVDPTGFCDSPRLQASGGNACGESTNSLVNDVFSIAQGFNTGLSNLIASINLNNSLQSLAASSNASASAQNPIAAFNQWAAGVNPNLNLPSLTGQDLSSAQSQDYSSSDANYHIWTATSVAGVDMSPAQQAALFSTWRNSEWVAPGAPANAPDGEEIDLPVSLHDGPDPIIIQTNSAQLAWTNYTLPGHDFDPGQVVNSVVTINTSGVSVTYLSSVGTGIGPLGTVNGVIGPAFFGASQQAAIIQYYTGVAIPDPFTPHH